MFPSGEIRLVEWWLWYPIVIEEEYEAARFIGVDSFVGFRLGGITRPGELL